MPVEFKSSDGKILHGVLLEQDALYEAWHVRLDQKVNVPALDSVMTNLVMVMSHDLRNPTDAVVPVTITGYEWTCPNCGEEQQEDTSTDTVSSLCCPTCRSFVHGVLVDRNREILINGAPFPE